MIIALHLAVIIVKIKSLKHIISFWVVLFWRWCSRTFLIKSIGQEGVAPIRIFICLTFLLGRCPWIAGGRRAGGAAIYMEHSRNPTWPSSTSGHKSLSQTHTSNPNPSSRTSSRETHSVQRPFLLSGWAAKYKRGYGWARVGWVGKWLKARAALR